MSEYKIYPIIGRIYRHYKGGKYTPITLATDTVTNEIVVVYKSIEFGSVYTRPLDEWNECVKSMLSVGPDTVKRFELCLKKSTAI